MLTDRERLMLLYNDRNVIDSDSALMESLNDSDSDIISEFKSAKRDKKK